MRNRIEDLGRIQAILEQVVNHGFWDMDNDTHVELWEKINLAGLISEGRDELSEKCFKEKINLINEAGGFLKDD